MISKKSSCLFLIMFIALICCCAVSAADTGDINSTTTVNNHVKVTDNQISEINTITDNHNKEVKQVDVQQDNKNTKNDRTTTKISQTKTTQSNNNIIGETDDNKIESKNINTNTNKAKDITNTKTLKTTDITNENNIGSTGTYTLTQDITLSKAISANNGFILNGQGHTIDCAGTSFISTSGTVKVNNLTLKNIKSPAYVAKSSTLNMTNVIITDSTSGTSQIDKKCSVLIDVDNSGILALTNVLFENNTCTDNIIYLKNNGVLYLTATSFANNGLSDLTDIIYLKNNNNIYVNNVYATTGKGIPKLITNLDDIGHKHNDKMIAVTSNAVESQMDVTNDTVNIGETGEVGVTLRTASNYNIPYATITYKIDNNQTQTTTTNYNGQVTIPIVANNIGTKKVALNYLGETSVYEATNTDGHVSINALTSTIQVTDKQIGKINETSTIQVAVTDANGNTINVGTVTLLDDDDETVATIDLTETNTISFVPTTGTTKNYTITYDGTESGYESSSTTTDVTAVKIPTHFNNETVTTYYGQKNTIEIHVYDEEGNEVKEGTVSYNEPSRGLTGLVDLSQGNAFEYDLTYTSEDTRTFSLTYAGSDNYEDSTGKLTINIAAAPGTKTATHINDETVTAYMGQYTSVTINVLDDNGNPVNEGTVRIVNSAYSIDDEIDLSQTHTYQFDARYTSYTTQRHLTLTYSGSDNYEGSTGTLTVNIENAPVTDTTIGIITNDNSTTYNSQAIFVIETPLTPTEIIGNSTGKITIEVDGLNVTSYSTSALKLENGTTEAYPGMYVNLPVAGEHNIIAYFTSNSNQYTDAVSNPLTIKINPVSTTLTANPITIKEGETAILNVTLSDAKGNVLNQDITAIINNNTYTANTGSTGTATFTISNLTIGEYTVTLNYAGGQWQTNTFKDAYDITTGQLRTDSDWIHATTTATTTVTVETAKTVTTTTANDTTGYIGQIIPITINVLNADGNRVTEGTVRIYSPAYSIDSTINLAEGNVYNYDARTQYMQYAYSHDIPLTLKYSGSDNYMDSTGSFTLHLIKPLKTVLTIDNITPVKIGYDANVTGTLKDENGNPLTDVTITVNNKTVDVTDGVFKTTLTAQPGENTVTIIFTATENYQESQTTKTFTGLKHDTNMTVEPLNNRRNTTYGGLFTFRGTLKDTDTGAVIPNALITINGRNGTTDSTGRYEIRSVLIPLVGDNLITATYAGNDAYNSATNTTIIVGLKESGTNMASRIISDVKYGTVITFDGNLFRGYDDGVAGATVIVNGIETTTDENGDFKVNLTAKLGFNNITIYYPGDEYNYEHTWNRNFTGLKHDTNITINASRNVSLYNNTNRISGILTDLDTNTPIANTKIIMNGIETTTNSRGSYSVTITIPKVGENIITVAFAGDDNYNAATNTTVVTGIKHGVSISTYDIANVKHGQNVTVRGSLADSFDNRMVPIANAVISINGVNVTTDGEGNFNGTVVAQPGVNTVSIQFTGDENHTGMNITRTFTGLKHDTGITFDSIGDVPFDSIVTITGKLVDANNAVINNADIIVTVNGVNYTITTDANGVYILNVPVALGENNVIVSYAGNASYNIISSSTTYNGLAHNTTITVEPINNSFINDNVTVNGILSDVNETTIADANIVITANNNTYNITTDANGSYSVTIPVITGINNITVIYNGIDSYTTSSHNMVFNGVKRASIVTVDPVNGTIGEPITLVAHITDINGNPLNEGCVVLKLNGKTLRIDGSFNSTAESMKFNVTNGTVTYTFVPDDYLKNIKNIRATYSGSDVYRYNQSDIKDVELNKRDAVITITTNDTNILEDSDVTFTANLVDITPDSVNTTAINDGYVIFKVNGKTLRDEKGSEIKVEVTNNTASYIYHVPRGMTATYSNGTIRNYNISTLYVSEVYKPGYRNSTTLNIAKSESNINFENIEMNNTSRVLTITGNITDYNNNLVVGNSKVAIRINGETLLNANNKTLYYTMHDGKINLKYIIPTRFTEITSIELISNENNAYLSTNNITNQVTIV